MHKTQQASVSVGRNDSCPCNSGKKYKACCLLKPAAAPAAPTIKQLLQRAWQAVAEKDAASTLHWFQQVLKQQADHPEALAGLGQALCWQNRLREGLSYLQQAAAQVLTTAHAKKDVGMILQLAEQLHHWGDLLTALQLSERALQLEPSNPAALNNHALYLVRLNRHAEALPLAQRVCQLKPQEAASQNLLAIIEAQLGDLQQAKQRFLAVIEANRQLQQTTRAWQELVSVLDKLGEYDAAFAACVNAKSGYLHAAEYRGLDRQHVFNVIAYNKAGYDAAILQRWQPQAFDDQLPAPVFLMGFLRSGTTLTEQVLAAHPEVYTSDENHLIHDLTRQLRQMTGCPANDLAQGVRRLSLEQASSLRRYYWQRVAEEYGAAALERVFIDKVALNSIDIGLIACLFPEARILFALRDPRDVCLSCFQQVFSPSTVTVNLLDWQATAKQYAAVMDLWLSLSPRMQPRFLQIRYEDTVTEFETSFRAIFALLGLDWTDEIHAFHQKAQGRYIATPSFTDVTQPLYTRSLARWQHYQNQFAPVLPMLEPYIKAFGYA